MSVERVLKPRGKIMTMDDVKRLRGSADKRTHLARYEFANDEDAPNVMNVDCPDCGAQVGVRCK